MNFANSNIRISLSLSPGEPLGPDDRLLHQKIPKTPYDVLSRLCGIAFTIPYHRCILMDNYLHLSFIHSSPVDLVITRCTEVLSIVSRILYAYCLAVPFHLNTPTDNSSLLSSIYSFPVVHVFCKRLRNTIRSFENPKQPVALEILAFLHYG